MKRLTGVFLAICLASLPAWAENEGKAEPKGPADKTPQAQSEGQQCYDRVVTAYMYGRWKDLDKELKAAGKHTREMSKEQRADISYIRKMPAQHRPKWWKRARSASAVSFKAKIWGKPIMANYMPTEALGFQMPVDIHRGKVRVIVSWKPSLVDNPRSAKGKLAKAHGIVKGHLGEAIVWHELGHNYITSRLPAKHVLELYRNHGMLYSHLQEFYADMTALYHCSPRGRLVTLMIRLDGLDWYQEDECHTRASYGIGSIVLANVLMEPDKWPSMHFPSKVPQEDPERKAIIYLYEHIDPKWTLAEDRALRKMIGDFIDKKGNSVFKKRGRIPLPNKLVFRLMATDDREAQPERDAWVSKKLAEMIKSGRADKTGEAVGGEAGDRRWGRSDRIEIPW